MNSLLNGRRLTALLLVVCALPVSAHSQNLVSAELNRATVVTDSRQRPKAIRVAFAFSSPRVVDRVKLSFREVGAADYSEVNLKLDSELLYEGLIPYSVKIEYYLTVLPERGAALIVGSNLDPRLLVSEGLPRVAETHDKKIKKRLWICVAAVVGALLASTNLSEHGRPHKSP